MADSSQLRRQRLAARDALSAEDVRSRSDVIQQQLLQQEIIKEADMVFIYVSFRSEVDTFGTIEQLLGMGKTVCVPITYVKEKRLDAIRITDIQQDLIPGYCNIPEPKLELCQTQVVPPVDIDAIILPGSVFDERGGRFGYGGGYYDRFVSSTPGAKRIGIAFDLQIVDRAPLAAHDELLDLVITEKRIIIGSR